MADAPRTAPAADLLVRRLRDYGVRHVFGYPGGQLMPIYDALYREPAVRHFLARDEQAAAFMADGFARATGRPGVCLAVCGPGVLNAATPLATAFSDSIPVLLISGQIPAAGRGVRSGYYHENEQLQAVASFTKARLRVDDPRTLVAIFDEAWAAVHRGRPGPVFLEVPLDVLRAEAPSEPWPSLPPLPEPATPRPADVAALARLLAGWKRPLILAGGGAIASGAEAALARVAERLGAPVFHTSMGKGAFPARSPLHMGLPWHRATSDLSNMADCFSPLFGEADGLLAVGCRFTQLATGSWTLRLPAALAQIDVDPEEIGRHYPVQAGIFADARRTLEALLAVLPDRSRPSWAKPQKTRDSWTIPGLDLLGPLRRVLPPDGIVAADVTRLAYVLMAEFPLDRSRTFLHPAGSVAMGYGIPAALGAKAGRPEKKVVVAVGDGGFLMSGMELATAMQERLPVVVVLVNDNSLTLIRATQERRYHNRFIGVDLRNPDFGLFAKAFGVAYQRAEGGADFEAVLAAALEREETALIEVRPGDARG